MTYKVHVEVLPLPELLDPQGKAVHHGLHNLGINAIGDVRVGKLIQLSIEAGSTSEAEHIARAAAEQLLTNPIMEGFSLHIKE